MLVTLRTSVAWLKVTMKKMMAKTATVTAPSSGRQVPPRIERPASALSSSFSSSSSSSEISPDTGREELSPSQFGPIPRPDEPNLYQIPAELRPEYRPLPWWGQGLSLLTAWIVATWSTMAGQPSLQPTFFGRFQTALAWGLRPLLELSRQQQTLHSMIRQVLEFLVRFLLVTVTLRCVCQDLFLSPSRISTPDLIRQYFLPSRLSRYGALRLPISAPRSESVINTNAPRSHQPVLNVHWLEYLNSRAKTARTTTWTPAWDAVYVNHGFGACSLSWLPALAPLTEALSSRCALGHDAVGFGFTDRPRDWPYYTSSTSAWTAATLLQAQLAGLSVSSSSSTASHESSSSPRRRVLLLGHSMGAATTLRMSLLLDSDQFEQHIILVAPAFVDLVRGSRRPRPGHSVENDVESDHRHHLQDLHDLQEHGARPDWMWLPDLPLMYGLRRLVGSRGFWRKGLSAAWGNPHLLSDSDVLRFQWPSIGQGWERALLRFSRAQVRSWRNKPFSEKALLQEVLNRPRVKVDVIVGSEDRVIRPSLINQFLEAFPTVRVVEMNGLGHDPFEEDVEGFVQTVQHLIHTT